MEEKTKETSNSFSIGKRLSRASIFFIIGIIFSAGIPLVLGHILNLISPSLARLYASIILFGFTDCSFICMFVSAFFFACLFFIIGLFLSKEFGFKKTFIFGLIVLVATIASLWIANTITNGNFGW